MFNVFGIPGVPCLVTDRGGFAPVGRVCHPGDLF